MCECLILLGMIFGAFVPFRQITHRKYLEYLKDQNHE